ncbi:unnamed protein product [Cochlearia groenlandica]
MRPCEAIRVRPQKVDELLMCVFGKLEPNIHFALCISFVQWDLVYLLHIGLLCRVRCPFRYWMILYLHGHPCFTSERGLVTGALITLSCLGGDSVFSPVPSRSTLWELGWLRALSDKNSFRCPFLSKSFTSNLRATQSLV